MTTKAFTSILRSTWFLLILNQICSISCLPVGQQAQQPQRLQQLKASQIFRNRPISARFPTNNKEVFSSVQQPSIRDDFPLWRNRRTDNHIISDCITVTSDEGHFLVRSIPDELMGGVCGVYFLTDADKIIEITTEFVDADCDSGALISFVDGWELNGQLFPSQQDHPIEFNRRFHEFCGHKKFHKKLISSQNAALFQYRFAKPGQGFEFTVKFERNPAPCNMLLEGTADAYTLRNYGKPVNCTITTLFPAKIQLLSLSVGMSNSKRNLNVDIGTIHKCAKRGLRDYLEVGGGEGLDVTKQEVVDSLCGLDSLTGRRIEETILCGVTSARLVSSGYFDNAATISIIPATEMDIDQASLICDL